MRLLQLTTSSGLLDLHPHVSIVQGMGPDDLGELSRAVLALARTEAEGDGLLEAHGVMFPLEPELLAVLDADQPDLDPVVRRGQLPGQVASDAEVERRTRALDELLQRLSAAVEAKTEAAKVVEAAATAVAEARRQVEAVAAERQEAALAEAERSAREASAARQSAEEELRRLDERRRALEARVDPESPAALAAASQRWLELLGSPATEAGDGDEPVAGPAGEEGPDYAEAEEAERGIEADGVGEDRLAEDEPVEDELVEDELVEDEPVEDEPVEDGSPDEEAEIERRLAVIDEVLAELREIDPEPLRSALAEATAPTELVPVPEAGALAEDLAVVSAEIEADEGAGVPGLSDDVRVAAERLDAARIAVAEAEHAVRDLTLSPEDAAELDAAHEALHEALDKIESPLAGPRARKRVEQLRAQEQAILDRLGLLTYAHYVMGTSIQHRSPGAEAALRTARAELEAAEAVWDELTARQEALLAHAARRDRRRDLTERARVLVGSTDLSDDALVSALRDLRVPGPPPAAAIAELRGAIEAVGIDLGDETVEPEELFLVAEAWLAEIDDVDARVRELDAERAELEGRTSRARELDAERAAAAEREAERAAASAAAEALEAERVAAAAAQEAERAAAAALEAERVEAERVAAAALEAERVEAERVAALAELEAVEQRHQAHRDAVEALAALAVEEGLLRAAADPADADRAAAEPSGAADAELDELREALVAAEAAQERATEDDRRCGDEVAAIEAEWEAEAEALERLEAERELASAVELDLSEIEWFLMAKVAAQRATSLAGSTPLVIADAFPGLPEADVHHLLDQLERMADSVQIIVVSDAPHLETWVDSVGEARAAVVRPVAS